MYYYMTLLRCSHPFLHVCSWSLYDTSECDRQGHVYKYNWLLTAVRDGADAADRLQAWGEEHDLSAPNWTVAQSLPSSRAVSATSATTQRYQHNEMTSCRKIINLSCSHLRWSGKLPSTEIISLCIIKVFLMVTLSQFQMVEPTAVWKLTVTYLLNSHHITDPCCNTRDLEHATISSQRH